MKKKKPEKLNPNISSIIKKASDIIEKGKLKEDLSKAIRGGTANLESRQLRLSFLQKEYNDG